MKFIIKKLLLVCLIAVCFSNILMSMDIGLYLTPKFLFEIEDSGIQNPTNSKKNIQNMYIGGGLAIGYNFDVLNKYSTVRLEIEYLYRNPMLNNVYLGSTKTMQSHSFLMAAYYDVNFIYINYDNPDSVRSQFHNGKRPVMSIYAGFLIGGALNTYITESSSEYYGIFNNITYYNKFQFLYGGGGGLAFHITPLVSLDFSYRILFSLELQSNHDIIASLRFNF